MKQSREFKESMERFERLFRGVVAVPKSEVEKEEAKERLSNQKKRAKRKSALKNQKAGSGHSGLPATSPQRRGKVKQVSD